MRGMSAALSHLVLGMLLAASSAGADANESRFQAFSRPASIKLLPASRATAEVAITSAKAAIAATEALLDAQGTGEGGIGRLNGAAGGGPQVVDGQVLEILERALSF